LCLLLAAIRPLFCFMAAKARQAQSCSFTSFLRGEEWIKRREKVWASIPQPVSLIFNLAYLRRRGQGWIRQ